MLLPDRARRWSYARAQASEVPAGRSRGVSGRITQESAGAPSGSSLSILVATAAVQAVVVALSGSGALLGDTLHNAANDLTAVPLGVAFQNGQRPATRRYTYGYGRAEDLAGVCIVVQIAASCAAAAWEAVSRLESPRTVSNPLAVATHR